jgi:hypothetical protein
MGSTTGAGLSLQGGPSDQPWGGREGSRGAGDRIGVQTGSKQSEWGSRCEE